VVGAGLNTLLGTGSEAAVGPAGGDCGVSGVGFVVWAAVPGFGVAVPLSAEFCHPVGGALDTL
jgi:hypothetical protein